MSAHQDGKPLSVRSRARVAVRAQVTELALELFLARGFEETTIEQIAKAAGMSRATFFRYFPAKEDVVLGMAEDFAEQSRQVLSERPADEPVWTALRRALEPAVRQRGTDLTLALRTARVLFQSSALRARHHERHRIWRDVLVPEVARRIGATTDPRSAVLAPALVASALGCFDAAVEAWAQCDGVVPLPVLLDSAMAVAQPAIQ